MAYAIVLKHENPQWRGEGPFYWHGPDKEDLRHGEWHQLLPLRGHEGDFRTPEEAQAKVAQMAEFPSRLHGEVVPLPW